MTRPDAKSQDFSIIRYPDEDALTLQVCSTALEALKEQKKSFHLITWHLEFAFVGRQVTQISLEIESI